MKKFKDFLYDNNDILIAILILIIAALIIFWRMHSILDYPNHIDNVKKTTNIEEPVNEPADEPVVNPTPEPTEEPVPASVWENGKLSKDITVTVKGGNATAAVNCLIEAGLFDSYSEYESVCKDEGLSPEMIAAGTFKFKAGETKKDIANWVNMEA